MKRSELLFGAILVPIDFMALLLAGAVAYYLRLSPVVQGVRPAQFAGDLLFYEHMQPVAIVSAVIVAIFAVQGLYAMDVTRKAFDEFTRIFSGISIGIMLIIIYIFLRAELFQSRFIVLVAYVLAVVLVAIGRSIVRYAQRTLLTRGMGIHRVVLAGNGSLAKKLDNVFRKRPHMGYRVVAHVDDVSWKALDTVYIRHGIDEIIQANPKMNERETLVLLDFCEQYKIDFKYVPNMFETHAVNVRYTIMGNVPVIELARTPLDGWGRIAKRVIDITGALFGLIILSPLFAVVALLIKRESSGPVFYRQVRVGRNMMPFEIFKFRSMFIQFCLGPRYGGKKAEHMQRKLREQANERGDGPLFKMKNDPRVTRIGRWIRKTRIDELPQLINVLLGEMSLFGPRPHLPEEVERYEKVHRRLFTIKPGMSGMAQVAGNAGLSFREEAKLDMAYIENWSLWLDIIILIKTFRILFFDKNAI